MHNSISLIRGCSLSPLRTTGYALGTLSRVVTVTSPHQRTALTQLALGANPLSTVSPEVRRELEIFLATLQSRGFLNTSRVELATPQRSLNEISQNDMAVNQLRARSAPELAQSEWIDGKGDGGVSTITARSAVPIELGGRSRVISLLYSILLASGVSRVRFADRHWRPTISDLDIGFGPITADDLGGNYYEICNMRRRQLSLLPIAVDAHFQLSKDKPLLAIHFGDCDPEQLVEWSQQGIAHYVIHPPLGDEIVLGPLVIPGKSPCNRCLSLYELDNFGFSTSVRLPLTAVDDLPAAVAHYIAAVIASQILHFIDSGHSDDVTLRNTGVGEITYINFQRLAEPQVVAIARHPLCGCDR